MAHYFIGSNVGSTTGNAVTLGTGDDLYLSSNTYIEASAGYGIYATISGGVAVEAAGTVYGSYAIYITNSTPSSVTYVFVDPSGTVASQTNGDAIYITGGHQVVNRGQVSSIGGGGYGISTNGSGAIANYGSISAGYGIVNSDFAATDTSYLLNSGSIAGTNFSYTGGGAAEFLVNTGTMLGGMLVGNHAGNAVVNSGLMDLTSSTLSNSGLTLLGSGANAFVINTGTIQETVNDGTTAVNLIKFGDGNQDVLRNEGVIYQGARNGASNAVLLGGGIGDGVQNDAGAKITGNVTEGSGNYQFIVNLGMIEGNVTLGAGVGDVYNAGTSGMLASGFAINCGAGGDQVYGGAGTTTINGGAGSDVIVASSGGGRMTGGGGSDQLYTSAGAEVFAYAAVSDSNSTSGVDVIHGFRTGVDHVDLTAFHITNASAVAIYSSASATALVANVGAQQLTVYFAAGNAVQASDLLF